LIQESQDIAALLDQIRSGKEGRDAVISQLYYDQSLIKRVIDDQYDLADDYTPETLLIDHSKKEIITTLLERLGRNCKEVLLHWANGYKMAEIADIMKYKSEGMVRKKKYQCFKELLSIIETNPQIKTILK